MGVSTSPQQSPNAVYHHACSSPHLHHLNSPPSSPSRAAAVQASESFDKEGLVAAHWSALHDARILEKRLHHIEGMLPAPTPSLPPQHAKPILIRDLKLGKVHRGRALNGTLCTHSLKVYTVYNVIEDETGMATKLRICNAVPVNYSMLQAQRLYPKGSKIAVLDPYLTEFSDGTIGILVEKPSDIMFLWVPEVPEEDLQKLQVSDTGNDPLSDHQETENSDFKVAVSDAKEPDQAPEYQDQTEETEEKEVVSETKGVDQAPEYEETDKVIVSEAKDLDQAPEHQDQAENAVEGEFVSQNNGVNPSPEYQQTDKAEDIKLISENKDLPTELLIGPEDSLQSSSLSAMDKQMDSVLQCSDEQKEGIDKFKIDSDSVLSSNGGSQTARDMDLSDFLPSENEKAFDIEDAKVKPDAETKTLKSGAEANGNGYQHFADPLEFLDARSLRIRGNTLFAQANWVAAADMYTRAIAKAEAINPGQVRDHSRQDEDEVLLCYSNRSEAWLRLKQFTNAQSDAEKALVLSPNHAKSLFRMGRAYLGQGRHSQSMPYLEAAKKLAPNDKDLQEAIKQCALFTRRPKPKSKRKQQGAM